MHGRAEVAIEAPEAGAEQEHAGERRDADVRQLAARIERRLDIDDRRLSGLDFEAISA